ncbi:hypothetical protein TWF694_002965 [Orbilia ellipsospora]|uniref:F-box domain-containing protein n=1 Tax=Orbilia ellipsospora TaxID=2528407 RepID=A0AAV9X2J1_9PEZI
MDPFAAFPFEFRHNLVTMEMTAPPIMRLPTELHTKILSYLRIHGQIRASLVCKLWQTILTETHSFSLERYIVFPNAQRESVHALLEGDSVIECALKGDKIASIHFTELEYPIPPKLSCDISCSKILDDPLFVSPMRQPACHKILIRPAITFKNHIYPAVQWMERTPEDTTIRSFLKLLGEEVYGVLIRAQVSVVGLHDAGYRYQGDDDIRILVTYSAARFGMVGPGSCLVRVRINGTTIM